MKRAAILTATGLVALATTAFVRADATNVDQKFCQSAASFASDAAELDATGPNSTLAEVRSARSRIETDVDQMATAASWMKTPTPQEFLDSVKRLYQDINDTPDNATLQQSHLKIEADVQNARNLGRQLAVEAGCPEAS
jgi:hypothetical protein